MRYDIDRILNEKEKHLAFCPKDDWFDIINNKQNWDKSLDKIELFWKIIRKIISYDLKFNTSINLEYIFFPAFEDINSSDGLYKKDNNFFYQNEENIFNMDISFISATFYAKVDFSNFYFKNKVKFDNATFNEEAFFNKAKFQEEISFKSSFFQKEAYFKFSRFYKIADFSRANFHYTTSFRNAIFYNTVSFRKVVANGDIYFLGSEFRAKVDFWSMQCESKAEWISAKFFSNVFLWDIKLLGASSFNSAIFKDKVLFSNTYFKDVSFSSAIFEKSADFSYTRFEKGIFSNSCFYEINFENTIFEYAIFTNIFGFEKTKKVNIKASHIANKETARIFKNFAIKKNNITEINKFYAIELEKTEETFLNKDNLNIKDFIVLKIYKFTSCYSQNYILPLLWFILSGAIFTFFYPMETNLDIFITLVNPFELVYNSSLDGSYDTQEFISRVLSIYFIYHFIISIRSKTVK